LRYIRTYLLKASLPISSFRFNGVNTTLEGTIQNNVHSLDVVFTSCI